MANHLAVELTILAPMVMGTIINVCFKSLPYHACVSRDVVVCRQIAEVLLRGRMGETSKPTLGSMRSRNLDTFSKTKESRGSSGPEVAANGNF